MNVPDVVRGPEGQGNSLPARASEAVRTANSLQGMTTAPDRPVGGGPSSSTAKWVVAAVVLAVMVFGITFALNFMGSSGKEGPVENTKTELGERLQLTFPRTQIPEAKPNEIVKPVDAELHKPGSCDFWFENTNSKPVALGLLKTSCTCTGAQVFLLSQGSKQQPGSEAQLEKTATVTPLTVGSEEGVTVGPGQVGWVRLQWSGESKKELLSLTLWLNYKALGPFPTLETLVRFHDAFNTVQPAFVPFGGASVSRLPWTQSVVCWSSTRDDLRIKGEVMGGSEGVADLLTVGEPEPLTKKEREELAARIPETERPVRSAYRVPVTLRDRTPAGKLIDAGSFRRRVELALDGEPGEMLSVLVEGDIQGDVQVVGLEKGRIDFLSFLRKNGSASRKVRLQSLRPGLKLEVDRERTPEFLDVKLIADTSSSPSAGTAWDMIVQVKPDAVSGRFPRDTPESFRDCAVYVRPAGDTKARATRIAVDGIATD
jgi:hypothetical protein